MIPLVSVEGISRLRADADRSGSFSHPLPHEVREIRPLAIGSMRAKEELLTRDLIVFNGLNRNLFPRDARAGGDRRDV